MKNFDDILSDLSLKEPKDQSSSDKGRPLTVWLSMEDKARYDRLQKMSRNKFSRKIKEVILALIYAAEAKAS